GIPATTEESLSDSDRRSSVGVAIVGSARWTLSACGDSACRLAGSCVWIPASSWDAAALLALSIRTIPELGTTVCNGSKFAASVPAGIVVWLTAGVTTPVVVPAETLIPGPVTALFPVGGIIRSLVGLLTAGGAFNTLPT